MKRTFQNQIALRAPAAVPNGRAVRDGAELLPKRLGGYVAKWARSFTTVNSGLISLKSGSLPSGTEVRVKRSLFLFILPMHGAGDVSASPLKSFGNSADALAKNASASPARALNLGHTTMATYHDKHHTSGSNNISRFGVLKAVAASAMLMTGLAVSAQAQEDGIDGYWVAADGKTVVSVDRCSEKSVRICGTVVYEDGEGDAEIGLEVLGHFKHASGMDGKMWASGRVTPVEGGKAQKGTLTLLENGKLKVVSCGRQGCAGSVWSRPDAALAARVPSAVQGRR